jgi:ribosomal protein S18 acetylase RimI-like enzyme
MSFRTRRATQDDEPFLWEILYQAIFVPPGAPSLPRDIVYRDDIVQYLEGWGRPSDLGNIVLASGDDEPVGAAWLRLWTGTARGHGYVDASTPELTVAIVPKRRGQGAGTYLLSETLRQADDIFDAVSLSVSLHNPAMRLYRRLGFEGVSHDGTSLTMRRRRPMPIEVDKNRRPGDF